MLAHGRKRAPLPAPELRQAHPTAVHRDAKQGQLQFHAAVLEYAPPLDLDRADVRDRRLLRAPRERLHRRWGCRRRGCGGVRGRANDLGYEQQVLGENQMNYGPREK